MGRVLVGYTQAGGAGSGKVNIQDVSLTKYVDALSPGLVGALATGQHFQTAAITFTSNSGTPVVRLLVEALIITSPSTGGSTGEARLTENVCHDQLREGHLLGRRRLRLVRHEYPNLTDTRSSGGTSSQWR